MGECEYTAFALLPSGIGMEMSACIVPSVPSYGIKSHAYLNLPYTDIRADASNGFALNELKGTLEVKCSDEILSKIPFDIADGLFETLRQDPRPSYQDDPERIYGMRFGDMQVKFKVDNKELEIVDIT